MQSVGILSVAGTMIGDPTVAAAEREREKQSRQYVEWCHTVVARGRCTRVVMEEGAWWC